MASSATSDPIPTEPYTHSLERAIKFFSNSSNGRFRFVTKYIDVSKNVILEAFPETTLPMIDDDRTFKYGQFGYGKFVYSKEQLAEMKDFFEKEINEVFRNKEIKYII